MIRMTNESRALADLDFLLQSFLTRFHAIPARQRTTSEVTFAQMRVLWVLNRRKSASLGEVANQLGIAPATATTLVTRLVDGGQVRRVRSAEDARRIVLTLRSKGHRVIDEFAMRRRTRLEKLLGVLAPADVARMRSALATLGTIVDLWEKHA